MCEGGGKGWTCPPVLTVLGSVSSAMYCTIGKKPCPVAMDTTVVTTW